MDTFLVHLSQLRSTKKSTVRCVIKNGLMLLHTGEKYFSLQNCVNYANMTRDGSYSSLKNPQCKILCFKIPLGWESLISPQAESPEIVITQTTEKSTVEYHCTTMSIVAKSPPGAISFTSEKFTDIETISCTPSVYRSESDSDSISSRDSGDDDDYNNKKKYDGASAHALRPTDSGENYPNVFQNSDTGVEDFNKYVPVNFIQKTDGEMAAESMSYEEQFAQTQNPSDDSGNTISKLIPGVSKNLPRVLFYPSDEIFITFRMLKNIKVVLKNRAKCILRGKISQDDLLSIELRVYAASPAKNITEDSFDRSSGINIDSEDRVKLRALLAEYYKSDEDVLREKVDKLLNGNPIKFNIKLRTLSRHGKQNDGFNFYIIDSIIDNVVKISILDKKPQVKNSIKYYLFSTEALPEARSRPGLNCNFSCWSAMTEVLTCTTLR